MKTIFSTLALLLVCSFSAVAQTTTTSLEGATFIGSTELNLNILAAPQPGMTFATETDRSVIEITYWLVGAGTTEEKVVTTIDAAPIMNWATNNPTYRHATESYVYDKVGAAAIWVGEESGVITVDEATVLLQKETTAGVSTVENSYEIIENGNNTEVKLVDENGNS